MVAGASQREPEYARPTTRKKRAGALVATGQMLLWNPLADMVEGLIARVTGTTAFRISTAVGSAAYYIWEYRQELKVVGTAVGQELSETVRDIPYRAERLAFRMAIPDFLSLVRPALGLVAAVFLLRGQSVEALGVYAIGIATDVVDGWLARRLRGGTSWGKDLDGITDSVMNLTVFAAVIVTGIESGESWFIGAAVFLGILWVATRILAHKHSLVAKFRSGVTRGTLYLAITATLTPPWSWIGLGVGALLLAFGGTYEFGVARRDRASGSRPLVGKGWAHQFLERRRTGGARESG